MSLIDISSRDAQVEAADLMKQARYAIPSYKTKHLSSK